MVMANKNVHMHIILLMALVAIKLYCCNASNYNKGWCVANTGADRVELQKFLDYGCSEFDCSPILPGGACYEPNVLLEHGSWILDKFYREGKFCVKDLGFITQTNPSHESCRYP